MKKIHQQSLYTLETVGMSINHRKALEMLSQAGAILDKNSSRVRFTKKLVEDYLKFVPSRIMYGAQEEA